MVRDIHPFDTEMEDYEGNYRYVLARSDKSMKGSTVWQHKSSWKAQYYENLKKHKKEILI